MECRVHLHNGNSSENENESEGGEDMLAFLEEMGEPLALTHPPPKPIAAVEMTAACI